MKNQVNYTDKEEVTVWEVVDNLIKRILAARRTEAFCEEKIKNGTSYMGDRWADALAARAEANTAQSLLDTILKSIKK